MFTYSLVVPPTCPAQYPDEIPTEALKEIDEDNRTWLVEVLDEWWEQGALPEGTPEG